MGRLISVAALAFAMLASSSAHADITPGSDWSNPPYDPWYSLFGNTTLSTPTSGGNPGGWLQVTFPTTSSGPGDQWYDTVYTPATNIFAGTWTTNTAIQFDFWQSNSVAGGLALEFESTNGDIWSYSLTPPGLTSWTTYTVSFGDLSDWTLPFATEDQYLTDLSSIDWIGVYIYRDTSSQEIYGIDNVMLTVPEPAECVLLAAAVVTIGMSLLHRRRFRGNLRLGRANTA
jgi:hypothetical protein